jgi:hypothetical protein
VIGGAVGGAVGGRVGGAERESPARRHNLWPREPQAVLPHLQRWLQARWPAAPADKA